MQDSEAFEGFLEDLNAALTTWHSARIGFIQLSQHSKPSYKTWQRALDRIFTAERAIHQLIMDYAKTQDPEADGQKLLQQGFDPETMIMEPDGTVTR